jgi:hypothetical protein
MQIVVFARSVTLTFETNYLTQSDIVNQLLVQKY